MNERVTEELEEFVQKFANDHGIEHGDIERLAEIKRFPIGGRDMVFYLVSFDDMPIGSVLDFEDHLILTSYTEGGFEGKNITH